jgi:hypothetical protein
MLKASNIAPLHRRRVPHQGADGRRPHACCVTVEQMHCPRGESMVDAPPTSFLKPPSIVTRTSPGHNRVRPRNCHDTTSLSSASTPRCSSVCEPVPSAFVPSHRHRAPLPEHHCHEGLRTLSSRYRFPLKLVHRTATMPIPGHPGWAKWADPDVTPRVSNPHDYVNNIFKRP